MCVLLAHSELQSFQNGGVIVAPDVILFPLESGRLPSHPAAHSDQSDAVSGRDPAARRPSFQL